MPPVKAKFVDTATGEVLKETNPEKVGELWLSGPNVMQGYLNLEEVFARSSLRPRPRRTLSTPMDSFTLEILATSMLTATISLWVRIFAPFFATSG